jgi:hypothetical protein
LAVGKAVGTEEGLAVVGTSVGMLEGLSVLGAAVVLTTVGTGVGEVVL